MIADSTPAEQVARLEDVLRGIDDPEAARAAYGITTFTQPLTAMVRRGLDLLTARIADASVPDEAITLRGELIPRGSTRPRG